MYTGAYDEVEALVKKYGTRDPFVLIDAMPDAKLWLTDSFAADGLKGFVTIQNRIKYVAVNSMLVPEERLVVAAHEIGHLFKHEVRLRAQPMQDFEIYSAQGKLEREANFFAANFLISDEQAMDEIHSCGADFFSVAKVLRIPAPFLAFKLYSLVERGAPMRMPVDLDNSFLRSRR